MLTIASRLDVMNRLGRAMADPTRSRILMSLLDSPSHPAVLSRELGLTRSNVSNHLTCLRKGIDGHQHLPPAVVGVADAFDDGFLVEIQAGEIARVGRVFQPHVNRVRAVVHGGFQGGQVAGGADEFGDSAALGRLRLGGGLGVVGRLEVVKQHGVSVCLWGNIGHSTGKAAVWR